MLQTQRARFFQGAGNYFAEVSHGTTSPHAIARKWCKAVNTIEERRVSCDQGAISTNLSTQVLKSLQS
jgi:hypothetical protein